MNNSARRSSCSWKATPRTLFLLMESDPTDELPTIIGIFKLFFVLKMILLEWLAKLAKLIGRHAARLSACRIAAIVSQDGALRGGVDRGCRGSSQKYPGFAERMHKGLVDVFDEKGRYVSQPLSCSLSLP
ncbi:hypothetical protein B0H19DRAFT_972169 [Mycena capillaripes]|nr:hypothetical protein B0H19DRAFT_972169 [Mycena capillaripes]